MKAVLPVLVIGLAICTTACSVKPKFPVASGSPKSKDLIIGKWQTGTGGTMEFHRDGRLTMAGPNGSVDVTYAFTTDNTFEMRKPGARAGVLFSVESISKQEVVLVDADGERKTLRRSD